MFLPKIYIYVGFIENMNKSVNRQHLEKLANELLSFLDTKKIESIKDLERVMKEKSLPAFGDYNAEGMVIISLRPSNEGTKAHTVSYFVEGLGFPIEFKINTKLGYSKMIIKGDFNLQGYSDFAQDRFGNIVQEKQLNSIDFSQVRVEIEKLLNYD